VAADLSAAPVKVNVRGTFLCYREAAKQMIKQGTEGRIIGAWCLRFTTYVL
jgi:NAD(P)-dependent dehydrogenase (short-subunit alcohol dehydrogenase family)